MSPTTKFLGAFMAASLVALGGYAYVWARRETQHFDSHMRSYASAYAASLAHGIAAIDVSFGPTTALIVVDQANQSSPQFRARWVALDEDSVLSRPILPLAELDGVRRGERFSREIKGERGQPGSLVTTYRSIAARRGRAAARSRSSSRSSTRAGSSMATWICAASWSPRTIRRCCAWSPTRCARATRWSRRTAAAIWSST